MNLYQKMRNSEVRIMLCATFSGLSQDIVEGIGDVPALEKNCFTLNCCSAKWERTWGSTDSHLFGGLLDKVSLAGRWGRRPTDSARLAAGIGLESNKNTKHVMTKKPTHSVIVYSGPVLHPQIWNFGPIGPFFVKMWGKRKKIWVNTIFYHVLEFNMILGLSQTYFLQKSPFYWLIL